MITDKDIVFVTTSIQTKWIKLCQRQVKKYFPESTHIVTRDSRSSKFYYKWIDAVKRRHEKYYVHVDEDCFLLGRDEIIKIIEKLELENYHLAGVPDAYCSPRNFNSVAMNAFFMVGKTEFLKRVVRVNNWSKSKFNIKWAKNENWMKDKELVNKRTEPYYPIYWAMLKNGANFLYLYPHVNMDFSNNGSFPATNVRLDEDCSDICMHMWYLRDCNKSQHKVRYNKAEVFLNE